MSCNADFEDGTNEIARVGASRYQAIAEGYTTTDDIALITDGSGGDAQLMLSFSSSEVGQPTSLLTLGALVENAGSNPANVVLEGRFHDPDSGTTSGWVEISNKSALQAGDSVSLVALDGTRADLDEYRLRGVSATDGASTTLNGYLIGKGM